MFTKQNIPNALTIFRGVATLCIIVSFLIPFPGRFALIYVLFVLAALTDFVDGRLARRWGVESDFGVVFDPLFDKLLVLTLILLVFPYNIVWPLFLILLFVRDLMTDVFRNYLLAKRVQTPAIKSAKLKTTMQMLMINFILLFLSFPQFALLALLANIVAAIATALSLFSGFVYTRRFALYFIHGK